MPLSIFRIRLVAAANLAGFLLAGGMYGTFLLLTLYMQQVLHLSVLQTGVAFLATAGTAVSMAGPAQALTTRFGAKPVLVTGMACSSPACLWYTQISADGTYFDGSASRASSRSASGSRSRSSRSRSRRSPASATRRRGSLPGLINTSQQVGGAIGTAVLSTVAFTHARTLVEQGDPPAGPLTERVPVGLLGRGRDLGRRAARRDLLRPARRGRAARGRSRSPPRRPERASRSPASTSSCSRSPISTRPRGSTARCSACRR